ncbi:MAG: diaminopimelate epimerase [Bacteroidales bacterium]
MKIYFNKYHGAGNDFIIIDNRNGLFPHRDQRLIEKMCDRHFGVGADGLMLLSEHKGYDFEMRYFNSDGKESTMCGNGGRCMVAFARKLGLVDEKARFLASDGLHQAMFRDGLISLSLSDTDPPVTVRGNHFINTGSPHYIVPVPDVSSMDVAQKGGKLRHSPDFAPGGTNVNFVESNPDGITVRTFERGVEAETLSCGTGVTAAAISSRWGKGTGKQKVKVRTPGGNLEVSFVIGGKKITSVCLTGPAEFVFEGVWGVNEEDKR